MLVPLDIPSIPLLLPDWMIGLVALHFMKPCSRVYACAIRLFIQCLYIYMKETKPKYYFLIDLYRHFVGEDRDSLSLKELQNLKVLFTSPFALVGLLLIYV
jgi:hypothetical protein